jgi:hypothetical protein
LLSISSTSADIVSAVPVSGVVATGRWDMRDYNSLVMPDRMRRLGCAILENRGAITDDPFAAFKANYELISDDRSEERCAKRDSRIQRAAEISWPVKQKKLEEKAKREVARYDEIYKRICAGLGKKEKLYTPAEGRWYLNYENRAERKRALEEANPSDLIRRYAQSASDRILIGYEWSGGMVANKYFQRAFVHKGPLKSEEHWLLQLFVAATAKASSGQFRAGPTKDSCRAILRKLVGYDEPYFFFGERCRSMFRIDVDRWFADEAALHAWIDDLIERGVLRFRPHVAAWIFDDKRPGIFNPHLYFVLPDDHAVWGDAGQHRMLGQVIASLTEALGGDPGGLSNPFHGKNPLSPHCDYAILNETDFPMLRDYCRGMRLTHDAIRMARKLMNDRMRDVGFDPRESNTWFSKVSFTANEAAKELYKAGFRIGDMAAFEEAVYNTTLHVMEAELPWMNWKQRETVEKLVESCSRWSVANFDPAKLDMTGRDVGAAAHLMAPDDDAKTRKQKGQAFAVQSVSDRNQGKVAVAIRKALGAGGPEPTFRQIADATGLSLNTTKKHWLPAYVQAVATLSIQMLVKGAPPTQRPYKPSLETLKTANSEAELPESWRDPALTDHFRVKKLKADRLRRIRGLPVAPIRARRVIGRNVIDFQSSGPVRVFRSAAGIGRPAAASKSDSGQQQFG